MKVTLLSLALSVLAIGSSCASALQFATGGGRGHMFVTQESARVAAGSLVRVGYLTEPGNISTFQEFAATTISNISASVLVPGFLTAPAASTTVAPAAKGAQVYLWVYNAPTSEGATQAGVFTSSDTSWRIPASFTGDVTETSNITLNLATGISAFADPKLGGVPTYTIGAVTVGTGTNQNGSIYQLAGVPEPSTTVLGAVLGLGLMMRRRRA